MLRRAATVTLALWLAGCAMAPAASTGDDSAAVATAAERLRVAMIDPTRDNLNPLILAVWQKQGGQWKLIARQAVRPPA